MIHFLSKSFISLNKTPTSANKTNNAVINGREVSNFWSNHLPASAATNKMPNISMAKPAYLA